MQQVGRAGRDGSKASATLHYNASDIGTHKSYLSDDVRNYCKLTTCRRRFLVEYFGGDHEEMVPAHNCCDNCSNDCACFDCLGNRDLFDGSDIELLQAESLIESSPKISAIATNVLQQYFDTENQQYAQDYMIPEMITGLSQQFATQLAKYVDSYKSLDTLTCYFPDVERDYLVQICSILEAISQLEL